VRGLGLTPGSLVLDLACGTGDFCRDLARAGYRAVGIDFASEMLRAAKTPSPLVQADVLALPIADGSADGAVSGFALRNVADLTGFFGETARVVRRGGRIALLEVAEPKSAVLRTGHRIWFHGAVPLLGTLLSDGDAYRYLPRSVAYLPPEDALIDMMRVAGFADIRIAPLAGGVAQMLTATRS
jgi:demethylmenaquinone methyltransferase/2-methoxy-6-polyprenyl-1,4-benzoquinol methylase